MNGTVTIDHIMVANAVEPTLAMPHVDIAHRVVSALDGGRTVNDDEINLSHNNNDN